MAMGKRTLAAERMSRHKHAPDTIQIAISCQRELLGEFEEAAGKLGLTPQALIKYMMLTSLKYTKPPEQTVKQWVRGK